jgi:hypothetical protein
VESRPRDHGGRPHVPGVGHPVVLAPLSGVILPAQVFAGSRPIVRRFEPVRNRHYFWKPEGGLWTSSHTPGASYVSEWVDWTVAEDFHVAAEHWLLEPQDARVAVIEDPDALGELLAGYRWEQPANDFRVRFDLPNFADSLLDYERLAEDYDALWVPCPRSWRFDSDLSRSLFFSIFDAESVLWFRWLFEGEPERLD